jgi:hypothetical protein
MARIYRCDRDGVQAWYHCRLFGLVGGPTSEELSQDKNSRPIINERKSGSVLDKKSSRAVSSEMLWAETKFLIKAISAFHMCSHVLLSAASFFDMYLAPS